MQYPGTTLRAIGKTVTPRKPIELQLLRKLRSLNICDIKPTRGGTAAGRTTFHHIQTRVSNKRIKNVCPPRLAPRTLTTIPKAHRQFQLPTVLLSNTRALTNKVDELGGVMRNNNVDIAVITETWLTAAVPQQAADIAGYCAHHRMRDHNNEKSKGGGVAIYIRDTIPVQSLDIKVPVGLECIWLRATPSHLPREISTLIVAGVYHPPKAPNESELIEHIAHTVTGVKIKHPDCRVVI